MKTYICTLIDRFQRFCRQLDAKSELCSRPWLVVNQEGDKEILFFQEDGTVMTSVNGDTTNHTWRYIPEMDTIIINHSALQGTMLHPSLLQHEVLLLQKDGTKECMFLVDSHSDYAKYCTLDAINDMLAALEEAERAKQRRLAEEAERERQRRLAEEEAERERQRRLAERQREIDELAASANAAQEHKKQIAYLDGAICKSDEYKQFCRDYTAIWNKSHKHLVRHIWMAVLTYLGIVVYLAHGLFYYWFYAHTAEELEDIRYTFYHWLLPNLILFFFLVAVPFVIYLLVHASRQKTISEHYETGLQDLIRRYCRNHQISISHEELMRVYRRIIYG